MRGTSEPPKDQSQGGEKPTPPPDAQTPRTVFTADEVGSIIKGFILAYVRGEIKLIHPTAEEIVATDKKTGVDTSFADANKIELESKLRLRNLIGVVTGATPSTQAELTQATEELFQNILALRNGNRIQGEFMEFKFEERVTGLEKKLDVTNNLVGQLVNWLTEEAKGS